MSYYILGIATSHGPELPYLYCRYLPGLLCEDDTQEEAIAWNYKECMAGGFSGVLPPSHGLEAIHFKSIEAAKAHIAAEVSAGSNWTYALWCSPEA